MNGNVAFFYLPVPDLKAARTFYRDQIGLEEAWREGEHTCAFKLPGTDVQLMLDEVHADAPEKPGLVFGVPSTKEYYQQNQGKLAFLREPSDIPGGIQWVGAKDASGHSVYVVDAE